MFRYICVYITWPKQCKQWSVPTEVDSHGSSFAETLCIASFYVCFKVKRRRKSETNSNSETYTLRIQTGLYYLRSNAQIFWCVKGKRAIDWSTLSR